MNLPTAIQHAQRLVSDCAASPAHRMPAPTLEQVEAIRVLVSFGLAVKPNEHASGDPLNHPDYSGCA